MKTLRYFFAVCLLVAGTVRAEDPTGIRFFTGSWKAVLAEAKRQNKPVFVDIYTTWCGPCKLMAKQAFPDAKVGEKFNASFINYQIDAEKGEGLEVAKKYAVAAYPTSLYVAANGDLIHRAVGYGGIAGMLDEADKAIMAASNPNSLASLEKQYADGQRDPAFLASYLTRKGQLGMPDGKALDDYLKAIPEADWTTEANQRLIATNLTTSDSKAFEILLNRVLAIWTNATVQMVHISPTAQKELRTATNTLITVSTGELRRATDETELERAIAAHQRVISAIGGHIPATAVQEIVACTHRRQFYLRTKNWTKYGTLATAEGNRLMAISIDSIRAKNEATYALFQKQIALMPDSIRKRDDFKLYAQSMKSGETKLMSSQLNSLAWSYYENMTGTKELNQALAWSAKSLEYSRDAAPLDTYAHLLSKSGRKAEAIIIQQEAIAKAKATGEDTETYEKSLVLIKQQL